MEFLIIKNGIIANIIEADEAFAESIGAMPCYEGAAIGEQYNPPTPPKTPLEVLQEKNRQLTAKLTAVSESNAFLEECIVEMAGMVYA